MKSLVSLAALALASLVATGSGQAYELRTSTPSYRVTLTADMRNVDIGTGDVLIQMGRSTVVDPSENMAKIRALQAAGIVKVTPINETRAYQAFWDKAAGEAGRDPDRASPSAK